MLMQTVVSQSSHSGSVFLLYVLAQLARRSTRGEEQASLSIVVLSHTAVLFWKALLLCRVITIVPSGTSLRVVGCGARRPRLGRTFHMYQVPITAYQQAA